MAARPRSWREVPASNPTRGARYQPGGLAAWRSVAPQRGSGRSGGRSKETLEQATRAIESKDKFNIFNAGGRALLGALDILDTPRAAIASGYRELQQVGMPGETVNFADWLEGTRDNVTMGEATGLDELGISGTALGFAADVAVDPLTYVSGGAARVGIEAGKPAARAFLKPATKEFLGEAATAAAERSGVKFADDAARAAHVTQQGEALAAQAAQKALKFRSNQALDALEREAIGAHPGTYIKIPGSKRLGIDSLVEKIVPGRVLPAQGGGKAFRATRRELGLGKLAGKARAKVAESAVGNKFATGFTKHPELRQKILFGTPEEAAIAFHGLEESGASALQRRLTESIWGERMAGVLARAKRAGIDGEDLRYAVAEGVDEAGEVAGDSSSRVLAKAVAANDPDLLNDAKQYFRDLRDHVNSLDPELPWLQFREDYTTRTMSDEAAALRGQWSAPGGALRREGFDFKRKYGLEPDQTSEFMGQKLLPPSEAGGRSVDRQIDDILKDSGTPNLFETDAYKAFPDYVRRISKRYGDEFLAKRMRDLGIAQPGWVEALTERGMSQGKAKAAIQSLQNRAAVRAAKAREAAVDARSASIASEGNLGASQETLEEVSGDIARYSEEKAGLEAASSVLDPGPVREYEALLRDQSETLAVQRQGLLDSIDMADVQIGLLNDAQVELAHRISRETRDAYERVTSLESAVVRYEDELADLYDRMYFLNEGVTPDAVASRRVLDEMKRNEAQIAEISAKMREAEELLHQFEDLAAQPTEALDTQLERVDIVLAEALEQYAADPAYAAKVNVLADLKASILHEKGVIERARGRVAELDRSDPTAWIDELDDLKNANSMGEQIIHAKFPELPDEISGLRLREFLSDRMPELERVIDDTRGQVLSAFNDRDTMRAELAVIRRQKREAEANLKKISKNISPKMREIWEAESELLAKADAAATRALEIEDELASAQEAMGTLDVTLGGLQDQAAVAEMFVAQQTAKHARYEAAAVAAEDGAANARKVQRTWDTIARGNLNKPQETALVSALNENFRQLGAVSMTNHEWLVDGLRAATIMNAPGGLKPALRIYDRVQNLWKGYALSTPGSINRNLFGGVFNNYLRGGLKPEDYSKTLSWIKLGGKGMSNADRELFQQLTDAGLLVSSGSILEVERRAMGATNLKPWSTDNKFLRFFRKGQEDVESLVRGSLGYRVLKEGGDINDAIGEVAKFHFDYDDLSAMERSVLRRIVPFYTWTRKNLPLMLEQIVQEPAKFTRFYQLKNEIELQSPEETLVPSYFAENLAVRLPFDMGSGQAYMLPDLPFTSLNDVSDPSTAFSQVSPFLKTPVEYVFGKQFFKGIPLKDEYQPVPRLMTVIPGLMPALDAAGLARRGPDGWSMKHKDLYVAEQMMPTYGRVRRLFPSESQFNERVLSSWLSFALGAGIRTNTPTDQRNEAYRRIYSDLEGANSRYELGYDDYGYTDEGGRRKPPSAYALYQSYFDEDK